MVSVCPAGWSMVATEVAKAPARPRTGGRGDEQEGMMLAATASAAVADDGSGSTGLMVAPASPTEPMMVVGGLAGEGQQPPALALGGKWGHDTGLSHDVTWGCAATADLGHGHVQHQHFAQQQQRQQQQQHHAAAGCSATASGTVSSASAPGAGAPLTRTGSGCKRPLPSSSAATASLSASSSSSSLATADAEGLPPLEFLHRILRERGYETAPVPADKQAFFQPPTTKQIQDYDLDLINAVKSGDLESLGQLAAGGRQMDACNRHGESIVHISCRRGQAETLRFLLAHGGRVHMCDDLGRTPLHDACWAKTPVFDCISTIMDQDPALIRVVDCRGASPLAYVRREHWPDWRHFFDSKKDTYWKPLLQPVPSSASSVGSASSLDEASLEAISLGAPQPQQEQQPQEQQSQESGAAEAAAGGGGFGGNGGPAKRVRSSQRLAAAAESI